MNRILGIVIGTTSVVAIAALSSTTPAGASECAHDKDCPGAQICRDGRCADDKPPAPRCDRDKDCPGTQVCRQGQCADDKPRATVGCEHDKDCAGAQICRDGQCADDKPSTQRCDRDKDCPGTQICRDGQCADDKPRAQRCDRDKDCPGDQVCREGLCADDRTRGSSGHACESYRDCPADQVCRDGRCTVPRSQPMQASAAGENQRPGRADPTSASQGPAGSETGGGGMTTESPPSGLSFGARVGYGIPLGSISNGSNLSDTVGGMIPLELEAGYLIRRRIYLGVYFQYGIAMVASNACPSGASCSGSDLRLGVEARYRFLDSGTLLPWAGLGIGYENLSISGSLGNVSQSESVNGMEFASLQLGLDLRASRNWVLGPMVSMRLAQYFSESQNNNSGSIQQQALHEWLVLGAAGRFEL